MELSKATVNSARETALEPERDDSRPILTIRDTKGTRDAARPDLSKYRNEVLEALRGLSVPPDADPQMRGPLIASNKTTSNTTGRITLNSVPPLLRGKKPDPAIDRRQRTTMAVPAPSIDELQLAGNRHRRTKGVANRRSISEHPTTNEEKIGLDVVVEVAVDALDDRNKIPIVIISKLLVLNLIPTANKASTTQELFDEHIVRVLPVEEATSRIRAKKRKRSGIDESTKVIIHGTPNKRKKLPRSLPKHNSQADMI